MTLAPVAPRVALRRLDPVPQQLAPLCDERGRKRIHLRRDGVAFIDKAHRAVRLIAARALDLGRPPAALGQPCKGAWVALNQQPGPIVAPLEHERLRSAETVVSTDLDEGARPPILAAVARRR